MSFRFDAGEERRVEFSAEELGAMCDRLRAGYKPGELAKLVARSGDYSNVLSSHLTNACNAEPKYLYLLPHLAAVVIGGKWERVTRWRQTP